MNPSPANKHPDPAAFPCEQGTGPDGTWNQSFEPGMSLADYFAAKAMQTLLSKISFDGSSYYGDVARKSYEIAKAMLAARAKFYPQTEP